MRLKTRTFQIAPPRQISVLTIFLVFFLSTFILRPIILFLTYDTKHVLILADLQQLAVFASLLAAIFLFFVLIGYKTCRASISAFPQGEQRFGSEGGLLVALFLLAASIHLSPRGGTEFISSIVDFREGNFEYSSPAKKALIQGINIYFILLTVYSKGMIKRIAVAGLALSFLPLAGLGDRSSLVLPIVVGVYALYRGGKISGFWLALFLAFVVILLIILGILRAYLLYGVWLPLSLADSVGRGLNMISYDQFLLYLRYSDMSAIRNGIDFFNGLSSLVPRSIWAGKAEFITPGAWLGYAVYNRDNLGFPFTVPGEWFANFGIQGVALGGYLTGFILRLAENTIRSGQYLFGSLLYFYTMLAGLSTLFVSKLIIVVIVPTALVLLSLRSRRTDRIDDRLEPGVLSTGPKRK